jgi:hypothetical protein
MEGYEIDLFIRKIRLRRCKIDWIGSDYGSIAESGDEHFDFINIGDFMT